jgi:hypothetical protein
MLSRFESPTGSFTILQAKALSGIVQLAATPGSGPGDWGSSPCPGVRLRPVNTGRFAFQVPLVPGFVPVVRPRVLGPRRCISSLDDFSEALQQEGRLRCR